MDGVLGVIVGLSYGRKLLGKQSRSEAVEVQRIETGGIKATTQSAKGLQELFIRTEAGKEKFISAAINKLQ